jgi:hypothetical protein
MGEVIVKSWRASAKLVHHVICIIRATERELLHVTALAIEEWI